jgi:hypothetical protein
MRPDVQGARGPARSSWRHPGSRGPSARQRPVFSVGHGRTGPLSGRLRDDRRELRRRTVLPRGTRALRTPPRAGGQIGGQTPRTDGFRKAPGRSRTLTNRLTWAFAGPPGPGPASPAGSSPVTHPAQGGPGRFADQGLPPFRRRSAAAAGTHRPLVWGESWGDCAKQTCLAIAGGVLLGGALTTWAGRQLIFCINVPIDAVALAVGWKVLPQDTTARVALTQFALPGAATLIGGLTALMFALGGTAAWRFRQVLRTEGEGRR